LGVAAIAGVTIAAVLVAGTVVAEVSVVLVLAAIVPLTYIPKFPTAVIEMLPAVDCMIRLALKSKPHWPPLVALSIVMSPTDLNVPAP
jgi:hypothetical protein